MLSAHTTAVPVLSQGSNAISGYLHRKPTICSRGFLQNRLQNGTGSFTSREDRNGPTEACQYMVCNPHAGGQTVCNKSTTPWLPNAIEPFTVLGINPRLKEITSLALCF